MIPLGDALDHLMGLFAPLPLETVALSDATGRYLATDAKAAHFQPPFHASAMDGFAVRAADLAHKAPLDVIGESAAGHPFDGHIGPNQAIKISTGAPVPEGADKILIKENCEDHISHIIPTDIDDKSHIRAKGQDFTPDFSIPAGTKITPDMIGLLAAMNLAQLTCYRRAKIALISTGDELIEPGSSLAPGQIIASNAPMLAAMVQSWGAQSQIIPIAKDSHEDITRAFEQAAGADMIVTTGGASVGDHDLIAPVAKALGFDMAFHKIAMRPGKPVMAGKRADQVLLGLPGNPVSAAVCARLFVQPAIAQMQGQIFKGLPFQSATLAHDLPANGVRAHFMRATLENGEISVFERQDSALLSILAQANALLYRASDAPAASAGDQVDFLPL